MSNQYNPGTGSSTGLFASVEDSNTNRRKTSKKKYDERAAKLRGKLIDFSNSLASKNNPPANKEQKDKFIKFIHFYLLYLKYERCTPLKQRQLLNDLLRSDGVKENIKQFLNELFAKRLQAPDIVQEISLQKEEEALKFTLNFLVNKYALEKFEGVFLSTFEERYKFRGKKKFY